MFLKNRPAAATLAGMALICASASAFAAEEPKAQAARALLFLTETNASPNSLAVLNATTKQTEYVPTGGNGGTAQGGNAGGVAVFGDLAAAINFGSSTVTVFQRHGNAMQPLQTVKTTSKPVSVAFGQDHLVVLGTTTAESFPVYGATVGANDGIAQLQIGDGSSAQIITYTGGAIYTEKTGSIGLLNLSTLGSPGISGPSVAVKLPAAPNNNVPFGMVADGPYVYASIAHSALQALIVNGQITTTVVGPTPVTSSAGAILHAPCWNAMSGHFLFSTDSPGMQILRYLVSDSNIFIDKIIAATFNGPPTDLAIQGTLMGIIDGGNGAYSDVTLFDMNAEGELTQRYTMKIAGSINGAAIIQ